MQAARDQQGGKSRVAPGITPLLFYTSRAGRAPAPQVAKLGRLIRRRPERPSLRTLGGLGDAFPMPWGVGSAGLRRPVERLGDTCRCAAPRPGRTSAVFGRTVTNPVRRRAEVLSYLRGFVFASARHPGLTTWATVRRPGGPGAYETLHGAGRGQNSLIRDGIGTVRGYGAVGTRARQDRGYEVVVDIGCGALDQVNERPAEYGTALSRCAFRGSVRRHSWGCHGFRTCRRGGSLP